MLGLLPYKTMILASGTLIYYRNIGAQEGLLDVPLYLGASLEARNVWDDRSDMGFDDLIVAGSGFLGATRRLVGSIWPMATLKEETIRYTSSWDRRSRQHLVWLTEKRGQR